MPAVDRHVLIEVAATDQSGAAIMDEKVQPPDELVDTRESITGLTIDDFAGAFLLVAVPFVLFAFLSRGPLVGPAFNSVVSAFCVVLVWWRVSRG